MTNTDSASLREIAGTVDAEFSITNMLPWAASVEDSTTVVSYAEFRATGIFGVSVLLSIANSDFGSVAVVCESTVRVSCKIVVPGDVCCAALLLLLNVA
jgi:hypothetical protein